MPPRYNPDTIGFLMVDVARMMRAEFDRRNSEAGLGLTPAEARTLSNVARIGPVRQSVLAERMGIEAMTLSACLDRLEAQGLVERATDPSDRRAKLVDTTDAAGTVLERIFAVSAATRADMTQGIEPDKAEEFRQMLLTMRANLVAMRPECGKGSDFGKTPDSGKAPHSGKGSSAQ